MLRHIVSQQLPRLFEIMIFDVVNISADFAFSNSRCLCLFTILETFGPTGLKVVGKNTILRSLFLTFFCRASFREVLDNESKILLTDLALCPLEIK